MEVPEWIQAARDFCADGHRLRGLAGDVWTRDVSHDEDALLAAGADGAELTLTAEPLSGFPVIRADGDAVYENRDEYNMANQWQAFCSLCRRGVVEVTGDGDRFYLTDIARDRGHRIRAQRLYEKPETDSAS